MSALVVIPSRYGSTRFPGKPLALLAGKPMIQQVYERAARATRVSKVLVATDDERIVAAVAHAGGTAVMTSPTCQSGTERAAEVARAHRAPIVINVQGDEPLIHPEMVDQLVDFLERHPDVPMASLMTPLQDETQGQSPNVVKVVIDREGFALYFSRAPIPSLRQPDRQPIPRFYKHIGIYGYQRAFLLRFPSLEPTTLEQLEQLEQLRALEHGYAIKMLETTHDAIGVDTPEDLRRVESLWLGSRRTVAENG